MNKEISVFLENEKNTSELRFKTIRKYYSPGLLFFLKGDLGVGKTCLVRSIFFGLGFEGKVKSPSYSLFEHYIIGCYELLTILIYIDFKLLRNGFLQDLMSILMNMILQL